MPPLEESRFASLIEAILLLKTPEETQNFLSDLCTPQELKVLSERWKVCQFLDLESYSYREIHQKTTASLTTIGRVSRFLKDESYHGYRVILDRWKLKENSQKGCVEPVCTISRWQKDE